MWLQMRRNSSKLLNSCVYHYSVQCVPPFCQQSCSGICHLDSDFYLNISVSVTFIVLNDIKCYVSAQIVVSTCIIVHLLLIVFW